MLAWISGFHECDVDRIVYTNEWDCSTENRVLPDPLSPSVATLPPLGSRYAQEYREIGSGRQTTYPRSAKPLRSPAVKGAEFSALVP